MVAELEHTIWCKICGITRVEDAAAAQSYGADAIGLVFYAGSARAVALPLARDIGAAVTCTRVALFVDPTIELVEQVVQSGCVDMLQFHGEEKPEFCRMFGLPYMKALRVQADMDISACMDNYADAWAMLFDSFVAGQPGGTGTTFDWRLWPRDTNRRCVLAGGLTPANVGAAITQTGARGVDVSGGVEGPLKGQKDPRKIAQFLTAVRQQSQEVPEPTTEPNPANAGTDAGTDERRK